ncbi:glycosyltransferase family 4 protein [Flavihumibacter petaseus]|uniref:Putative glycosyltransferase n=1 Tax=Flavihumibacter petaseus NBRC 106054 TaxID=1220578 RepID=A0A0E9N784_9BACT|nr:glycosyltransferase family 4 protein [Flavihumibacter petaseus]GAO45210.1 putative glycosyltransferase [Flavihumibacter petaseus NBRC 106054]
MAQVKLAIVTTHPVQYNAPWFRQLANHGKIEPRVFYTWSQSQAGPKFDPGFGKTIDWDIPLLDGYGFEFIENKSKTPGSRSFNGIDNPGLIPAITAWGADAVLVMGWNFKSHLACMRHFKGKIPVLFRGDSTLLDEAGTLKRILRRLTLSFVYRFIDYALYVGSNNKAYFQWNGVPEYKLINVPHAIDNARFSDKAAGNSASELRRSWGITQNDFVILFAGKLEPKKNPGYLIQLAGLLPDKHFKFILAGSGEQEDALKAMAAGDSRIIFPGFLNQTQMPALYHCADVFVLPSLGPGETWGLALNEAMAAGRPVIATTKTGGAADLIQKNRNGVVFDGKDTSEVIRFIRQIATDRSAWQQASVTSSKIVRHFSFESIVTAIEQIFIK